MTSPELPDLPECFSRFKHEEGMPLYHEGQMRAYALSAIAAQGMEALLSLLGKQLTARRCQCDDKSCAGWVLDHGDTLHIMTPCIAASKNGAT
jgi:hypothetical protein